MNGLNPRVKEMLEFLKRRGQAQMEDTWKACEKFEVAGR